MPNGIKQMACTSVYIVPGASCTELTNVCLMPVPMPMKAPVGQISYGSTIL